MRHVKTVQAETVHTIEISDRELARLIDALYEVQAEPTYDPLYVDLRHIFDNEVMIDD